jgi:SagB-type dehydrogenase family enzyme
MNGAKWKIPVIIAAIILLLAILFIILSHLHDNRNKGREEVLVEAKEYKLSEPVKKGDLSVEEAIADRRSVRTYSQEKIEENDISQLLWAAQGITDEAEGLRTAPSAGALYPLEIYVAIAMVEGIEAGLYKYNPSSHSLILKKNGDIRENIYNVSLRQDNIKNAAAVIIYCAVFERTFSRYKERATQYVYIETGHSAQNVYLQAEALNLGTVAIGAFDNEGVKKVLDLPDEEDPVYLMPVGRK